VAALRRLRQIALNAGVPRCLRQAMFVEVFAGCARLSKAFAARGFIVVAWDILYSPLHDLTLREARVGLVRLCLAADIVWLGIPCDTFSRARRFDGRGPRPLRDNDNLRGFPDLEGKNLQRLQLANVVTDFAWYLVRRLRARGIPGAVENPLTSMLWLLPTPLALCQHSEVSLLRIDFCQYGTPWRKATRLLSWHWPLLSAVAKQCSGTGGVCSKSHDKHITLSGTDSSGQWMTRLAQPYPRPLCRAIASAGQQQLQHTYVRLLGVSARAYM
jgi:hypothetical protein